uniref:Ubiquitin carboxyl-terminal hydrolase n=1 Tax=Steinernema glaseri TaxID=37863 RepID=A0A1I7XY02_9BILA
MSDRSDDGSYGDDPRNEYMHLLEALRENAPNYALLCEDSVTPPHSPQQSPHLSPLQLLPQSPPQSLLESLSPTLPQLVPESPPESQPQTPPELSPQLLRPADLILGVDEVENDPRKTDGVITLVIDNFKSMFNRNVRLLSGATYLSGAKWRLLVYLEPNNGCPWMSAFVKCDGYPDDERWACWFHALLTLEAQYGGFTHERYMDNVLRDGNDDWGFKTFMELEHILEEPNGFYKNENDTVRLVARIITHRVQIAFDGSYYFGFVGLVNKGATCYLNVILQSLYFCKYLRKVLLKYNEPTSSVIGNKTRALMSVFKDLEESTTPVDPTVVIEALDLCVYTQRDAHELMLDILDFLEKDLKDTADADAVSKLFKGKMENFIRCTEVQHESKREEEFMDVQLSLNHGDVLSAFREYVRPERLEGDNKYDAGEHGLQPAEKGLKFLQFPPVLNIQLVRFQPAHGEDGSLIFQKDDSRFEFPQELDLNEFVDTKDNIYVLQSVISHCGHLTCGHYISFVNVNLSGEAKWMQFDDDRASRVIEHTAVYENFGGTYSIRAQFNAYMLIYVKKSAISEIVSEDEDISK